MDETVDKHCDECETDYKEPAKLPEGESDRCPKCHSASSWGFVVRSKEGHIEKQDQRVVGTIKNGRVDLPGRSVPFQIPKEHL